MCKKVEKCIPFFIFVTECKILLDENCNSKSFPGFGYC
jgi:hypothetical protein